MVSATATRSDVFAMMPTGFAGVANSDIEAEDTPNTVIRLHLTDRHLPVEAEWIAVDSETSATVHSRIGFESGVTADPDARADHGVRVGLIHRL